MEKSEALFIRKRSRPCLYMSSEAEVGVYATFSSKEGGSDGKEGGSDGNECVIADIAYSNGTEELMSVA